MQSFFKSSAGKKRARIIRSGQGCYLEESCDSKVPSISASLPVLSVAASLLVLSVAASLLVLSVSASLPGCPLQLPC